MIIFCAHVILVGGVKQQLAFQVLLKLIIPHSVHVKLVLCHQSLVVFTSNLLADLFLRHGNTEVEVAE